MEGLTVISSQEYINYDIVEEKKEALSGASEITLGVWETEVEDLDGNPLYILFDGHHTLAAARELGICVDFVACRHPEGLTGEQLLDNAWLDSNWRYVENDHPVW